MTKRIRYARLIRQKQDQVETRLQLGQEWLLGNQVGGGGFGQVYEASSAQHEHAVVKLVPKVPGADRELLFVELRGVRNVVPIIDSGQTEDYWALVMPRAEQSLRDYLDSSGGPLDTTTAVAILSDVAAALADLAGHVVHRDLKPENILLLDDHWRLADFGISRYAEATTAPDTRKFSFTPRYAAPEQWRYERATTATDVYAFGVITYELLAGNRPFVGPGVEDLRDQHLHKDPPVLPNAAPSLAALVEECLYKAPEPRPSPSNILARMARIADPPASAGSAKLQQANQAEATRRGKLVRAQSEQRSESERRTALVDAAKQSLRRVADALKDEIVRAAALASFSQGLEIGWAVQLNQAELRLAPPATTPGRRQEPAFQQPPFEVVAFSTISVKIPPDRYGYGGRSHSLWFCDAQEADNYQWFETAFLLWGFSTDRQAVDPFALNPGEDAAQALGPGITPVQVAWPFTALSAGEMSEFSDRWLGWLADASQGQLHRPSHMPERDPKGSWRQP